MTGEGFYSLFRTHRLIICLMIYRGISSVLTLVPIPQDYPVNNTVEVGIYHSDCPDGYFRVLTNSLKPDNVNSKGTDRPSTPCRHCSLCRRGEQEITKCTATNNTRCGCSDGLKYAAEIAHCIPPDGLEKNWTIADYNKWREESHPSPTSERAEINLTTKVSHNPMMSKSINQDNNAQVEHAVKPDWTDFYILTVSSTAVLFFTLSLVLLFLMAVMKARSWYLYRRLPGSGITLCFRGWLSRALSRPSSDSVDAHQAISMVARTQSDQGTTARDMENNKEEDEERALEPILMTSTDGNCLRHYEVIDYISGINAIICCADLHFTFPLKKTYVSSCITSEEDVMDTRSRGSPNFILQACHNTVNVVLGQESHKCCRHRNKLILTSNDLCLLGQFEAATMEVQDCASGKTKSISSLAKDTSETWSLLEELGKCQHEQKACIKTEDILNLYMEIATPFKKSPDLKFKGSLRLYLKNDLSSHHPALQEKVKLKYKKQSELDEDVNEPLLIGEDNRHGKNIDGPLDSTNSEDCLAQLPTMVHHPHGSYSSPVDSPLYSTNSEECLAQQPAMVHHPCGSSSHIDGPLYSTNSEDCLAQQPAMVHHPHGSSSSLCLCNSSQYVDLSQKRQSADSFPGSAEARSGGFYCIPTEEGCLHKPSEAVCESSVEVVVDVHNDIYADELQPLNCPVGQMSDMLVITSV